MQEEIILDRLNINEVRVLSEGGELWRDCPYFSHRYEVSHLGNYRNKGTKVLLKPQIVRNGYVMYYPNLNGKNHGKLAHRLVAKAFLANIDDKSEVNHLDCDKENNTIFNLDWATKRENTDHAMLNKRYNNEWNKAPEGYAYRKINGKMVLMEII